MPSNGFVNLHNHSDYSILDGYSHPGEYVKRAAELGQTAVGLTDHGNLFGAFDFIKSARAMAKSYDRKNHPQTPVFIKPIIGIEAYMAPQNPDGAKCKSPVFYSPELKSIIERRKELGYNSRKKVEGLAGEELQIFKDMEARERELRGMDVSSRGAYTHLTLIAINDVGFHNLIHLTTEASKREHYYQHGRMDFDMLTRWNEGIIATTGCPSGEIQTRLRLGQVDEAYDYARRMAELFDGRYYVELMLHNMPSDLESSMIPKLKKLADDLDLPLLATNDSHYARPEDSIHHEEMLCVQTNSRGGGVGAKGFVTMNCLKNDDPAPDRMISVKQRDGSYKEVPQPRRFAFQGDDYYLKTYDEMIKAFPEDKFPGAVSNTVKIADMVGDWWIKDGALDIDALEESYREELEAVRGEAIDANGAVTLPHATGGRTSSVEVSGKGLTALGSTADATDVEDGFHVDALTQRLVDDGKIAIGPYDLSLNTDLRPEIQIPEGWTEEEWFKKKINEGFVQRRVAMGDSDEILEDSKRRIADEFPVFAGKNFIQYMLVVQDYINWAREHGVSVGEGRGSVGGSEIAYLMDISRTDPVRHDLLFERFLNPERNSPPDVDTDFKASVRNRVLQYAKDKYGYDKVANIITFGTFQFKQAFRDVAKIYQMTNAEVDRISKLIPEPIDRVAPTMHDLYDPESPFYAGAAEFREVIASNDEWKPIIESTDKISGRVRQTGTHACGVIMSSKPISDYAPLFWTPDEKKAKSNIWTDCMVGWEYPDLESIGLIKMDFLPLSTLDLIDDTIDNIKSYNDTVEELAKELEAEGDVKAAEAEGSRKLPVPNLDNIEVHGLEDAETFKTLANGDSDAVFQLGSDGQKALLKRIEPDRFEDIVAINALYRPGPMGMNAHLEYADRKNGRAPAYIIDEKLDKVFRGTPVADVLGPTYGLCVPAGTPILDCTTGEYVPIEEFPIGHKTISFNEETNKWNNNEVSDVFHTGKHDIVRITTRNHKVVEVADTHPLLTQRGWVRAGELLESDSLVLCDGLMDENPNDSDLTPDLLKELGRSYSPITSIQIVGEHECWDMTVENDHTYTINGFVGHNCIYQESVMQISRLLCGFTRGQADSLRKAIGHKIPEEMEANHKRFVDGAMRLKEENGWIFSRSDVEALWSYIEKFASYGFNRSHSVSYAIDAYKTAYLKTHYYPFFMASCMTADLNNKDKFAVYLRNVEDRGLKVGPVNVNHSNKGIQAVAKKSPDDPDIVFGFDKATGVNADLADEITRTREKTLKGEFKSFDEFMMNMESLNAGALTGLANAGAFDDLGIPRKAIAKNAKDLIEFYRKKRASKTKISGSLFGMMGGGAGYDAVGDYDFKLTGNPTRDEYPLTSKLKAEKDSLSVYVSASPVSNAGAGLDVMTRTPYYWRASTVEDVTKLISENTGDGKRFFRKEVRMIGWFSDLTYKKYRSGTGVFFIGTFSDKTGNLGVSVNGGLAEQMAAAVGLRPMDDNPLSGRFPVSAFYKSGELNTVRKGNAKPTVDEQVERLTDVLVDVTVQITNDRVKVKSLSLVPTTPDGRVPLTLRLRTERGASNRKFLQVIEIMKSHPGDVPVVVDIKEVVDHSSKPTLMGVPLQVGPNNVLPFGVDLSEEMINEVSKLRDPEDFFMSWAAYEASAAYDPVHQG